MLRILILLFTLNALLLPISGVANVSVADKSVAPMVMKDTGSKCQLPMSKSCPDCDMDNMDMDCDAGCCTHCAGHIATLPTFFSNVVSSSHNTEIITAFKHFYLHTTSPEQRPPLV